MGGMNEGEGVRLAFCTNYLELEDRPCDGYLRFHPGDIQAACESCGAWCGYLVASYVMKEADQ